MCTLRDHLSASLLLLGARFVEAGTTMNELFVFATQGGERASSEAVSIDEERSAQIEVALVRSSRWIPGVTCRHRAASAAIWLRAYGIPTQIVVGLARRDRFKGHAWVEYGGGILFAPASDQREVARW